MPLKLWSIAPLAGCTAAAAIALSPAAFAQEPNSCIDQAGVTVCQTPGNSNETVTPPQTGGGNQIPNNGQNGSYGPSGDTPPVGN
jgi:hypothetical protein